MNGGEVIARAGVEADDTLRVRIGGKVASEAPICVIIISVHSDPRTADALASLLAEEEVEIVVVNTGRGSLEPVLGSATERVTLVETPQRRLVGGARNLGIRYSRAPIVAFLASDCRATPGWISRRLAGHAAGHATVASALLPAPDSRGRISAVAWASFILTHTGRMPGIPPEHAARYGLSYQRSLFDRFGLFPEDVPVGEDTHFNARFAAEGRPLWDPAIVTLHAYPHTFAAAASEQYRRGRKASGHARRAYRRSITGHLWRTLLRGWLVNRRMSLGGCPEEAVRLPVRLLVGLLFPFYVFGSLSHWVTGRLEGGGRAPS